MNEFKNQFEKETGYDISMRNYKDYANWLEKQLYKITKYKDELYEDNEKIKEAIHLLCKGYCDNEEEEDE